MHIFPTLETERLILREITSTDLNSLFDFLSREDVTQFYGMDALTNSSQVLDLINLFKENFQAQRGFRWGIALKENGKLIGTCGFNVFVARNNRSEIGYELHPDYWRKGYVKEAISTIISYGFEKLNLNRIGAIVYPENIPSISLLTNLGFSNEGLLRKYIVQGNTAHDTFVLSILKEEWQRKEDV